MSVSCSQSQGLHLSPADFAHPNSTFVDRLHQSRWKNLNQVQLEVSDWISVSIAWCLTQIPWQQALGAACSRMGLVPNKAFLFCRLVHEKRPQASWSLQLLFKHHPHNARWFAGHLVCRGVQKVRLRVLFWPQDWADPQAALICHSLKMGCKTSPAAPHFLRESLKSCTDPVSQSDPQSCGSLCFTADVHVSWTRDVF